MTTQIWDLNVDSSSEISLNVETNSDIDINSKSRVAFGGTDNYEKLKNLPSINGALIKGAYTLGEGLGIIDKTIYIDDKYLKQVRIATTAQWNSEPSYVPNKGQIIIYSDYITYNNIVYAGIKIGDGNAYLIDLPFIAGDIGSQLSEHISNTDIHVSQEDRNFWNNKSRVENSLDGEELIITSL